MIILVTGSRLIAKSAYTQLKAKLLQYEITLLLHGGAKGADTLAQIFATEKNIPVEIIRPDYDKYLPKVAPLIRNTELVKRCELVIALYAPGRIRKGGTWDTVQKALSMGKTVVELLPNGQEVHTPTAQRLF